MQAGLPNKQTKNQQRIDKKLCSLENDGWNTKPFARNKISAYLTKSYVTQEDKNEIRE